MPSLHWIGKEKVINHHHDVPFRVLDQQYTFTVDSTGALVPETPNDTPNNLIIYGDNLEALKALLPQYEGRVKCIYIDPPYNTGNEGWVYNDNVNDPKIKRWLGQVVGKESEDLSRHDKWLCMMYPRLSLLHKLLAEAGVLIVSIDDNEMVYLKLLLNEIFGVKGELGTFVWRRRVTSSMSASWVSTDHEYVVVYSKNPELVYVRGEDRDMEKYNIPDKDGRLYASMPLTVGMTKEMRPNQWYELNDPKTGTGYWPTAGRVWAYYPPTMKQKVVDGKIIWPEDFPGKKLTTPRLKSYPEDAKREKKPLSTWIFETNVEKDDFEKVYMSSSKNEEGAKVIKQIFGDSVFTYAKPISLTQSLLQQFSKEDDIVLDSFAGSGTTAHAVINLNKEDSGRRQFILVEMEDYTESITAERVRRVMQGYGDKEGTGGQFDYYTLGERLFDDSGNLNPVVSTDKIRQYIWFTETKGTAVPAQNAEPYRLGIHEDTAYYFCYDPEATTTLGYELLGTIQTPAEQYIIYADSCTLADEYLQQKHIIFKKIPRDITRL